MRRVAVVFFLLLFAAAIGAEEALLTKAFTVKFKKVEDVASLVNTMLSDQGAVTMQPRLKTLVVQDHESNLRRIETAIAALDEPPPSVELSIKLVLAKKETSDTPVSDEIKSIAKIGEVLRFNRYSLLDSGLIESEEGHQSSLILAKNYQVIFETDVIQDGSGIIRLKNFQLKKKRNTNPGGEIFAPLISVTLNLRNGETLVLGASKFEDSDQALLLILLGKVKK